VVYKDGMLRIRGILRLLGTGLLVCDKPVIFVPGIKESMLTDSFGRVLWLKLASCFKKTDPLIFREGETTNTVGVLDRLTFFPILLEYKPCFRFMRRLALGKNGYVFGYDWRDYPDAIASRLGELVNRVIEETGEKPSLVAHSFGGLIAHSVAKEQPEKIDKLVYVSVPFRPGVNFFKDIHKGRKVGLNKDILSKEAIFSHPSSFALVPQRGSGNWSGKELMDAKTWEENKWSVFADREVDLVAFQERLNRIGDFYSLIQAPKDIQNRTLIITGSHIKTLTKIGESGEEIYEDGDARVGEDGALPFDHLPNMEHLSMAVRHDLQLNNKKIVESILFFLNQHYGDEGIV